MKFKIMIMIALIFSAQFSFAEETSEPVNLESFKELILGKKWSIDKKNTPPPMTNLQMVSEWEATPTENIYKRISYLRGIKMNNQPLFIIEVYDEEKHNPKGYYPSGFDLVAIEKRKKRVAIRIKVKDGKIYETYGKNPVVVLEEMKEVAP